MGHERCTHVLVFKALVMMVNAPTTENDVVFSETVVGQVRSYYWIGQMTYLVI